MSSSSPLFEADPWALPEQARTRRVRPAFVNVVLAAILGATGPVAQLASDNYRPEAWTLATVVLAWGVVLAATSTLATLWRGLLLAGTAAVAVAAFRSSIGTFAVLFSLTAVGITYFALDGRRPGIPGIGPRPGPMRRTAGLAIAPLIGAQIGWLRDDPTLVLALLAFAAALLLMGYWFLPGATDGIEGALRRGLTAIGIMLGRVLIGVTAIVVLYIPGVFIRGITAFRRSRPHDTTWINSGTGLQEVRQDASRPFASTPSLVRTRRNLLGLTAVVAVLAGGYWWQGERSTVSTGGDDDVLERADDVKFSDLAAYEGVDFADALKDEQDEFANSLRQDPITITASPDFSGEFTNVSNGARLTPTADCEGCRPVSAWLMGGSAAFGLGQRDSHTIAAELSELAADDGIALTVTNLAVPGWTIWQEFVAMAQRLALTDEAPDLVIFHDGYNDVVGTVIGSTINGIQPDRPSLLTTSDILAFDNDEIDPSDTGTPEELGSLAADRYRGVRRQILALAEARGIPTAFFFQPDAYASEVQLAAVNDIFDTSVTRHNDFIDASLESASMDLAADITDIRHLFDDLATPVFADLVHTNELGARLVAEAIYAELSPRLAPE